MTSPVAAKLLTAEEFELTRESPGLTAELVCGRIQYRPPPGSAHGKYAVRIAARLLEFAERHRLGDVIGEAGYTLRRNPDTVRGPDASFIKRERLEQNALPSSGYYEGALTLAVEVVSPSESEADVLAKNNEYLAAGAERVWEVRPRLKTVTVHRPAAEPITRRIGEALTSEDAAFSVDGFELPLDEIFR